jgi:3D (Asp-Asp-Asp) domain-containing protein
VKSWAFLCYGPAALSGCTTRSAARLAGVSAVLVLAVVSAAAAAVPHSRQAATLRGQVSVLDTRAHHALLDLYALDTRLQNARTRLASLQAQAVRLRAQQVLLSQQLSATQRTLRSSRKLLGQNLRTLYEQGDSTDALAVMLGAKSLDEAVTTIDDLTRVADQSRQVVEVTSAAQVRLSRLRSTIGARRARLKAAVAAALQTASDLDSAQAERLGFLTRLRTQQALKTQQIAALQAAVQRVEVKSQQLQSAALASSATPTTPTDTTPAPTAPTAAPASGRTITVTSTGYSLPGHTATGMPVGWGVVAVDPSVIPLGTRLTIPGYGEGVAADTGSAVRGATIDLWFPSLAQARAWGRRTLTITLH